MMTKIFREEIFITRKIITWNNFSSQVLQDCCGYGHPWMSSSVSSTTGLSRIVATALDPHVHLLCSSWVHKPRMLRETTLKDQVLQDRCIFYLTISIVALSQETFRQKWNLSSVASFFDPNSPINTEIKENKENHFKILKSSNGIFDSRELRTGMRTEINVSHFRYLVGESFILIPILKGDRNT